LKKGSTEENEETDTNEYKNSNNNKESTSQNLKSPQVIINIKIFPFK